MYSIFSTYRFPSLYSHWCKSFLLSYWNMNRNSARAASTKRKECLLKRFYHWRKQSTFQPTRAQLNLVPNLISKHETLLTEQSMCQGYHRSPSSLQLEINWVVLDHRIDCALPFSFSSLSKWDTDCLWDGQEHKESDMPFLNLDRLFYFIFKRWLKTKTVMCVARHHWLFVLSKWRHFCGVNDA